MTEPGLSPRRGARRRAMKPLETAAQPELSMLQRAAKRQRLVRDAWVSNTPSGRPRQRAEARRPAPSRAAAAALDCLCKGCAWLLARLALCAQRLCNLCFSWSLQLAPAVRTARVAGSCGAWVALQPLQPAPTACGAAAPAPRAGPCARA